MYIYSQIVRWHMRKPLPALAPVQDGVDEDESPNIHRIVVDLFEQHQQEGLEEYTRRTGLTKLPRRQKIQEALVNFALATRTGGYNPQYRLAGTALHHKRRVVGYEETEISWRGLDLTKLIVHPNYLRRGFGTKLVQRAMARANLLAQPLFASTRRDNEEAQALFETCGLQRYDDFTYQHSITDRIRELQLQLPEEQRQHTGRLIDAESIESLLEQTQRMIEIPQRKAVHIAYTIDEASLPIGYAHATIHQDTYIDGLESHFGGLQIRNLIVQRNKQRQGIGSKLVERASALGKPLGVPLYADVAQNNSQAQAFFSKEGFNPVFERKTKGKTYVRYART